MTTFVWKMHRDASELLGAVRTQPSLEVCTEGDTVWIRCEDANYEIQQAFLQLPVVHSIATDDGQLIKRGTRVPHGYVAEGPWIPIAQWMEVKLPIAGLSGIAPGPIPVELVRSETFETPQLLKTNIQVWTQYAVAAPRIRLDRLAFAARADGTVFVWGEPLPPIFGKRFVVHGRVAVEAGWTWQPAVDVGVLEAVLAIDPGYLAVMEEGGHWLSLADEGFVQATRSAVRTTSEELGYVC